MATARITNASQPKIAFLRFCALQRPARAAMFLCVLVVMASVSEAMRRAKIGPARFVWCGYPHHCRRRVRYKVPGEAHTDRGRVGPCARRCGRGRTGAAVAVARAGHDGRGSGGGDRRLHRSAGDRPAAERGSARAGHRRRRRVAVRRRVARVRGRRLARVPALDARAPGDRGVGAARGRVRRARRRWQRTPPVARRGRGRHGRRPRARRHSDRGIRLAGDLPRAGTDRAGGRAGAARHTDCDRARAPAAAAQGRARRDRAHPAVRSAHRGRVPACPVADQRLERRPAGGGRGGDRPAAGRGGRVVHPRRACDARRRRLPARGRGHRVPGPAAGGLGLVDDRPSAARRCGDGHGVSGTRRRAASRAHPRPVRGAALPAPRRHHARPRRAGPDRGRRARPAGRPGTRARHRARARRRAAPHRQDRACSAPVRRHRVREPARRARAGDDARAPQGRARGPRLPEPPRAPRGPVARGGGPQRPARPDRGEPGYRHRRPAERARGTRGHLRGRPRRRLCAHSRNSSAPTREAACSTT